MSESIPASAGGTSTAFVGLVRALRTQAGRVELRAVTQRLSPGDRTLEAINPGDPMWVWTGGKGRFRAGALGAGAAEVVRSFRPQVVHLHGLWCADLVAAAQAGRAAGARVIWQPHGMLVRAALARSKWKKKVFLALGLGSALRSADGCIFTSDVERATSARELLGPRTAEAVVPLPVAIEPDEHRLPTLAAEGRAKWGLGDAPTIVFVGRLHPVKRVDLTIAAFAHARRTHPKALLLLVGDGDENYGRALREQASRLGGGVLEAIVFAGWLDGDDKFRALAAGDVLTLNSEFENFGFAAVEALNCHTPVVMTDNLSLAQPAVEGACGLACASTPEALGDALARVLGDASRREMGRRGRRWVIEHFSHEVLGAGLAGFYERLIERGGRA